MRPPLTFFAAGLPAGQPRVKASSFGGHVRVYTPTTVKQDGFKREHPATTWKMIVRSEAQKAWHNGGGYPCAWSGPLCVNVTFYFPRPKSHFKKNGELKPTAPKWHVSKPDRDNCDKAVLDALTNLCIWSDDALVCDGRIQKLYAMPLQTPGVQLEIKEAAENIISITTNNKQQQLIK